MEFLIGIALRDAGFALSMAGMILLACGFAGFVFTVVRMRPRRGPALRCCPVCGADAVAVHEAAQDIAALRDEIVGADDLLARIPPATAPHRGLDA